MKTFLVITSYYHQGQIESTYRAYLPTDEESAIDQAADFWRESGAVGDFNTEIHYSLCKITIGLLCESFIVREDLIGSVARICALESVANGAPAIPEDTIYRTWAREIDARGGDFDFLGDVCGACSPDELVMFRDAFLRNLFDASPCGEIFFAPLSSK